MRMVPGVIALLACFIVLLHDAHGQTTDLKFDHVTVEQGLSQDIVNAIVQDSQGFMWFGTEDGLNRYDGHSIKVYKHNPLDSASITTNSATFLMVDKAGTLWVLTSSAMSRYDPSRDQFSHTPIDGSAFDACEDDLGNIWLGTGKGLVKFDIRNNKVSSHSLPSGDGSVFSLSKSKSGMIWLSTNSGLYQLNPGNATIVKSNLYTGTDPVSPPLEDSHGYLWYGLNGAGLSRVNMRTGVVEMFLPNPQDRRSLADPRILRLFEDRQGTMWVATFNGLDRYDPATNGFIHFQPRPNDRHSLAAHRVYSIFQDRDGALWVGTYRGGVSRTDLYNQRFAHYYHSQANPDGLPADNVLAIMEDSSGTVWLGTDRGGVTLFSRESGKFTTLFTDRGWGNASAFEEDRKGRIWIGTQGTGLVGFDRRTNTLKQYRHSRSDSSSIGDDGIQSLFVDSEGVLWIGFSDKGLDRYDERTDSFTHFWPDRRFQGIGVWNIQEDRNGLLWLGSVYGSSVGYCFHRSTQTFTIPGEESQAVKSLVRGSVRAMYQDSSGAFWLGAWSGGLYRIDPATKSVTQFTELDGLCNNFVKGMLADKQENLWISTENGLSRFNPRTRTFKNFTTRDGLQSNFFWSGSYSRGRDGRMYFGGTNGFNSFHPDSIKDNPNIPPIVITGFSILNQPKILPSAGEEITLSHTQDFFSFEFVALNFTDPAKNQYAYMMEGFDKDWIHSGTRRYAAYTHLDPGHYMFRARGSNNDGVWNENGASIAITIIPPYWQTLWFRSLIILLVASILYSLYRYRMGRLLEVEGLRSRIAADLHDDVGSNLSSIAIASQLIGRKIELPENERLQLAEIGTTALRTSEMMKEIVWLINPKNDLLDDLLLKMKAVAESVLQGIPYTFTGPQQKIAEKVDLDTKRNLYMMYKEILNNVVQHSSASEVSIAVTWNRGKLTLLVKDNGKGFDPATVPPGNGLDNLRVRSKRIGGELEILSALSGGTTVRLAVEIT